MLWSQNDKSSPTIQQIQEAVTQRTVCMVPWHHYTPGHTNAMVTHFVALPNSVRSTESLRDDTAGVRHTQRTEVELTTIHTNICTFLHVTILVRWSHNTMQFTVANSQYIRTQQWVGRVQMWHTPVCHCVGSSLNHKWSQCQQWPSWCPSRPLVSTEETQMPLIQKL